MTTTTMRESAIGDAWIHEACMMNPVQSFGGNTFSLGACRVGTWPSVFDTAKDRSGADTGKYDCTFLFPAYANLQPLHDHIFRLIEGRWPECVQGGQIFGLKWHTIRDQGEKPQEKGYTPGLKFIKAKTKDKPWIYDKPTAGSAPLTDRSKFYPGVWVVANVDLYIPKRAVNKGVSVQLNWMQIIADDKPLSSSGPNAEKVRQHMSAVRVPGPIAAPVMGQQGHAASAAYPPVPQGYAPPVYGWAPAQAFGQGQGPLDEATRMLLGY